MKKLRHRWPFFVIVSAAILLVLFLRVGLPAIRTDSVHIRMVYSSENRTWIESATKTFNAANHRTASGRPIVVDTLAADSGQSANDILQGTQQPTLWSPASHLWIPILNTAWTQKQGGTLITADSDCQSVAVSPMVIMMWKPLAQTLGWPNKPLGWADIAQLAADPKSNFHFAHTRPDTSDSGLEAVIGMTYAAAQKQANLTQADVSAANTAQFMNTIEGSVIHYGSTTNALGNEMITRGSSDLSAAVVSESTVINSYSADQSPESPLVAIYPKEGTFLNDYPVCIPEASWVGSEEKEAAGMYRSYLLSRPVQYQALQFGIRPADPSLTIGTPIDTDHGVDPTPPQILPAPPTSMIQAISDLWKAQKRQINLTLLIDVSGSMFDDNKLAFAQKGASAFIAQLDSNDTLNVITFDDQQHVISPNGGEVVGPNRQQLENQINRLVANNGTALYDAVSFALSNMKTDPKRLNAIVLLADNADNSSTQVKSIADLLTTIKAAENNSTPLSIFTIGYGSVADNNALQQIADTGHGLYFKADPSTIQQVYEQIAGLF